MTTQEIQRRYRERHKAQLAAKAKARWQDPVFVTKSLAREKFRHAVKKGWIARPFPDAEFHHPNYDRPYYGCWLTRKEHAHVHFGLLAQPACFDYADVVAAAVHAARHLVACKRGHPFTNDNLFIGPDGRRRCHECAKARQRVTWNPTINTRRPKDRHHPKWAQTKGND